MRGRLIYSLLLILLFVSYRGSFAASDTISVNLDDLTFSDSLDAKQLYSSFENNLDSMVNLWYIENSLAEEPDSAWLSESDSINTQYPDSIYIDRLSKLPSLVKLSYNKQVRNYIHVYTGKRRELVEVLLGSSEYYFPVFEEILDYYEIPLELKYCSIIESALNPRAVSRAGATGIWQFMYGTGRMYGLTINSMVDERRDPVKSTHAAARYMKDLYRIYGDWILVIAAYNCGPGNVNRAIRRSGGKRDFWDIYYFLPRETRGHVPAFIAATYTMNYYREHGLYPRPLELPLPVDTIMVQDNLHLDQVSYVLNVPKKMLRDINPQYKWDIIPGREKPYALKIPVEFSMQFIELEDSIFAFRDSVYFNPKKLTKSPSYYTSNYVPEPPSANMANLTYTIKSGDNLGFISEWYNVRVSDLKYWNNIYGSTIRAGKKLIVFVPKNKLDHYKQIDTMSFGEKQRSIGKEVAEIKPQPSKKLSGRDEDYVLYTIKYGDTLWDIAKKFPGVSDSDLIELNDLGSGNNIKPGMVIRIKPKA
ncbi:transglycosylase SLT domain-containing protein [Bacteroidota bacterium]